MGNKIVILSLAFSVLIITALSCDDTPPPPPEPVHYCNYLPTDLGNKWVYQVVEESKFNPREEYKLTYEIKSTKQNYEGFPTAYVITVSRQGPPPYDILAAPDDVTCYVERQMWSYLIANTIEIGGWTQTGLVNDLPLQYRRNVQVDVPAGKFGEGDEVCVELYFDNEDEVEPEYWLENYARYVGLVRYENSYTKYDRTTGELLDWRSVKYELESYDVPKREEQPEFVR